MIALPIGGVLYKTIAFYGMLFCDNPYSINVAAGLKAALPTCYIWLSLLVFLFSFSLIMKTNRAKLIYLIGLDTLYTLNCFIYIAYYRYFNEFPSIIALTVLKSTNSSMPSDPANLLLPINVADTIYFIDFMLLYIVGLIYRYYSEKSVVPFACKKDNAVSEFGADYTYKKSVKPIAKKRISFVTIASAFLILAISVSVISPTVASADGKIRQDYSHSSKPTRSTLTSPLGILANDIVMTVDHLAADGESETLSADEESIVKDFYEWKNSYYEEDEHYGVFSEKSVIFLQVEALEDFVIGASISGQEITPNLNKLLGHGYHFTDVRENVKHGNSSDGDVLYVGGMYPSSIASTSNVYGYNVFNGTPKILRKSGYKSAYYSCDELSAWNYLPLSIGMGYDEVFFDFDQSDRVNTYISDQSMLNQTVDSLLELGYNDEKFYSHTVIYSNHAPFRMPEEICELELPEELEGTYTGNYFQSVHYTDKCIGEFIDRLESSGLLNDAIVVIAGDHKGLHKYFPTDVTGLEETENTAWIPKNADAPLGVIIYDPTMDEGIEIDKNASQIDVQPTLLYLLGVDFDLYKNTSMGLPIFCKYDASISSAGIFSGEDNECNILYDAYYISELILKSDYFGEDYVDGHEVRVWHYDDTVTEEIFEKKKS